MIGIRKILSSLVPAALREQRAKTRYLTKRKISEMSAEKCKGLQADLEIECRLDLDYLVLPEVLEILKKRGLRARVAVQGCRIEKYPKEISQLAMSDHLLLNSTFSAPKNLKDMKVWQINVEILETHWLLQKLGAKERIGFRVPGAPLISSSHWLNSKIFPLLRFLGYYDSSRNAERPYIEDRVAIIPYRPAINAHRLVYEFPSIDCTGSRA